MQSVIFTHRRAWRTNMFLLEFIYACSDTLLLFLLLNIESDLDVVENAVKYHSYACFIGF